MSLSQRILILSAGSGSGHIRAGDALMKTCLAHPAPIVVEHLDCLEYTNSFFQNFYNKLYMEMVRQAPSLWGTWYEYSDQPWKMQKLRVGFERLNSGLLLEAVRDYRPDTVICTHPMPLDIISHQLRQGELDVHMAVVLTDYYIHAMWLGPAFHHYFTANCESMEYLKILGFPAENISVSGIPVDAAFGEPADAAALRTSCEFRSDLPLLLVSAGAFGVTSVEEILKAMQYLDYAVQVVVVCGKNEELQERIADLVAEITSERLIIRAIGYTDCMHDYMKMSDLFIGKPGGLTTAECLATGLPMMIYEPIPGQEEHNTEYLLEAGAALKPASIYTLPYKINDLLAHPEKLKRIAETARSLGRPDAARTIIDRVLSDSQARLKTVSPEDPLA